MRAEVRELEWTPKDKKKQILRRVGVYEDNDVTHIIRKEKGKYQGQEGTVGVWTSEMGEYVCLKMQCRNFVCLLKTSE